ncbi:FAD-binding oxidoreductase [Paraglaciecola sp. T6c]|uniref:FAD-binding oxidoreductase n=1 Tax=Pseudoalteromonas atlantica (strain T6c / ATCC BAA-1087) TaxID=3042615 RepID=UPI0018DAFB7B|nr:FAD-binding oxidoreductase [Paraglaciecola sp. T6c]
MPIFESIYVNPSRRDLLKKLVALGVTSLAVSPLAYSRSLANSESRIIYRDDPDYDDWRRSMLWKSNAPDRYPDVIIQAKSEQEITQALKFAQKNDLQVVCRTSGHNASSSVLRNGGMLLDISALNELTVDAQHKFAYVQPSVKMIHLNEELRKHGLDFPTASCQTVSLGGYLLGGGIGANTRYWAKGPACYSIISADVILADGKKITASKEQNEDIYWAIRGIGPGFFGIVTRFKLQVFPSIKAILKNTYSYPIDQLPKVIKSLDRFSKQHTQDERVSVGISVHNHPSIAGEMIVKLGVTAFIDNAQDPTATAKALLAPYAKSTFAGDAFDKSENVHVQIEKMKFSTNPADRSNQDNFTTDNAHAFVAIAKLFKDRPTPGFLILDLSYNSFNHERLKDASYSALGKHKISAIMHWKNAADDPVATKWFARFNALMQPYANSHYINEVNHEFPERVKNSFTSEKWEYISMLRNKYDPNKRFHTYLAY